MRNLNINRKGSYVIVTKKGKVVGKYRLSGTAKFMLNKLKKELFDRNLKIEKVK